MVVTGMHGRAVRSWPELGVADAPRGRPGDHGGPGRAAHAGLVLASLLERSGPGELVALVSLADGADVLLFRTTPGRPMWSPGRTVADQIAAGDRPALREVPHLAGMVTPEPPRRPEPQRVSSSAAWRNEDWKFGFVAPGTAPRSRSTSRPSGSR